MTPKGGMKVFSPEGQKVYLFPEVVEKLSPSKGDILTWGDAGSDLPIITQWGELKKKEGIVYVLSGCRDVGTWTGHDPILWIEWEEKKEIFWYRPYSYKAAKVYRCEDGRVLLCPPHLAKRKFLPLSKVVADNLLDGAKPFDERQFFLSIPPKERLGKRITYCWDDESYHGIMEGKVVIEQAYIGKAKNDRPKTRQA